MRVFPTNVFRQALFLCVASGTLLGADAPASGVLRVFGTTCADATKVTIRYLRDHGLDTFDGTGYTPQGYNYKGFGPGRFEIWGPVERVYPPRHEGLLDAQGKKVSNSKLIHQYSSGSHEKLPFGVWLIHMGPVSVRGSLTFTAHPSGCEARLALSFESAGAAVAGIPVVDHAVSFESNSRLENEYLDGIDQTIKQSSSTGR